MKNPDNRGVFRLQGGTVADLKRELEEEQYENDRLERIAMSQDEQLSNLRAHAEALAGALEEVYAQARVLTLSTEKKINNALTAYRNREEQT